MLPPVTRESIVLYTGSGSPVSMASSTCVCPSSNTPSAANRSPGKTTKRSPTSSSSIGISVSPSRVMTRAREGRKACKARMASVVCRLARASSHLPSSTKVITTAEPSKYKCTMAPAGAVSHNHTDSAQPALVPSATNKSILPVPASKACHPAL